MSILQELLKLREHRGGRTEIFNNLDLWLGIGSQSNLEPADVEVEFDYEAPSYTDHPYSSSTAREHHGAVVEIMSVKLLKDADEYDEDGDKVQVLKKGTDLMSLPWWENTWTHWLEDQIAKRMARYEPDF